MFRGFNVNITNTKFLNYYKNEEPINELRISRIANNIINGKKTRESWFPNIKADIFLSHSHNDLNFARSFAGYLEKEFNLKVFIDSLAWGYADKLQNSLEKYFIHNGKIERNDILRVSSHVNMMLANSLMSMIDECECFFFLNTKNSANLNIKDTTYTYSPWISYETLLSFHIRKKIPNRPYGKLYEGMAGPPIAHPLELNHLNNLNDKDLNKWYNDKKLSPEKHSLNILYENIFGVNQYYGFE